MSGSSVQVVDVYAYAQILLFDIYEKSRQKQKKNIREIIRCVRCGIGCASEDVLSIKAAHSTKH